MLDETVNIIDNMSMEREITSKCKIKAYDYAMLACGLDMTLATVLSALVDMRSQAYGEQSVKCSIREMREFLSNSLSVPTVAKAFKQLENMGLIHKVSEGLQTGRFNIEYANIMSKARGFKQAR